MLVSPHWGADYSLTYQKVYHITGAFSTAFRHFRFGQFRPSVPTRPAGKFSSPFFPARAGKPQPMGQTPGSVPKCNTVHTDEEKCNAPSALPNEIIRFSRYNIPIT